MAANEFGSITSASLPTGFVEHFWDCVVLIQLLLAKDLKIFLRDPAGAAGFTEPLRLPGVCECSHVLYCAVVDAPSVCLGTAVWVYCSAKSRRYRDPADWEL